MNLSGYFIRTNDMRDSISKVHSPFAISKAARNLSWLEEVELGEVTVYEIADREFLSPEAVRKALRLARIVKDRRAQRNTREKETAKSPANDERVAANKRRKQLRSYSQD
jgi:hypothetical protein